VAINVVIVEDEGLFRDMLSVSLDSHPRFEVIGSAGDGATAIQMARDLNPDVVIMDIELGSEPNGIEAGRRIKQENPRMGIVILSSHGDREYLRAIPLEHAQGWCYLLKQSVHDLESLTRALEGAASGLMVLDPLLVQALSPEPNNDREGLTTRRWEVLELIAQGYSNSAIAQKLVLTEKSVENYINAVYQQLQVSRSDRIHPRVKAVLIYLQHSLAK
jgi:DNA-binding NarL/FixJ family response regulator